MRVDEPRLEAADLFDPSSPRPPYAGVFRAAAIAPPRLCGTAVRTHVGVYALSTRQTSQRPFWQCARNLRSCADSSLHVFTRIAVREPLSHYSANKKGLGVFASEAFERNLLSVLLRRPCPITGNVRAKIVTNAQPLAAHHFGATRPGVRRLAARMGLRPFKMCRRARHEKVTPPTNTNSP
jgi:hypothetical protein